MNEVTTSVITQEMKNNYCAGNVYVNLQSAEEDAPTGAVMLSVNDYTSVQIGDLRTMLDELVIQNISFWNTDRECLDREATLLLEPIVELCAEFVGLVVELSKKCTPEMQAELDAALDADMEVAK